MHAKEVPLGESISAIVILEVQVVLAITDLYSLAQVSALKTAFEYQRLILVLWLLQLVKWPESLVVAIEAWPFRSVGVLGGAERGFFADWWLSRAVI